MSLAWQHFFATEFDLFSLTTADVCVCLVIAIVMKLLIRINGPKLLKGEYFVHVAQYSYDDVSTANIIYRLISPVVFSYFLVMICIIATNLLGYSWNISIRWLPILLYWILQILFAVSNGKEIYPVRVLVTQAVVSLAVGVYFDWVVVCADSDQIDFFNRFDQSNIGWQLLMVAFLAISNLILSGIVSGVNQYNDSIAKKHGYCDLSRARDSGRLINRGIEAKILRFRRRFGSKLPHRFSEDLLLSSFFYSIMLLEDSNRPSWVRRFERMFFFTGLVKTTGIMQVKSSRALSDEESVEFAIPIIERIWDSFLIDTAKANEDQNCPIILFCDKWYSYTYGELRSKMIGNSGKLYSRYCGTMSLDIRDAVGEVISVIEGADGYYPPHVVSVQSDLFTPYTSFLPKHKLFMVHGVITSHFDDLLKLPVTLEIRADGYFDSQKVYKLISLVQEKAEIVSIDVSENVYCEITVKAQEPFDDESISRFESMGWIVGQTTTR